MEQDRRGEKRIKIQQCVTCSLGHETFIGADIENISLGGALCRTDSRVYEHEKIFLMMDLPLATGTETIKVEGSLIHVQEIDGYTVFGVTFTDFYPGAKKILQDWLSALEG